jgi:hypothetical protein
MRLTAIPSQRAVLDNEKPEKSLLTTELMWHVSSLNIPANGTPA